MRKTISINRVSIRLEKERWIHIVEAHNDVAGMMDDVLAAVSEPDRVLEGWEGELLAVRMIDAVKAIVVVYRENNDKDGFIITAYITKRLSWLDRRKTVWLKHR